MRSPIKPKAPRAVFFVAVLTMVLAVVLVQCKSPTSPDGKGEADIIVTNEYGKPVDVYMDGDFMFRIPHKSSIEIDDVTREDHDFEAYDPDTKALIDSGTVEVRDKIKYTWVINGPPGIKVTNNYGQEVQIYMDGKYQFNLVNKEDRWIMDVPFGERYLKALLADDGREVASITIKVKEYTDYYWTITKVTARQ